MTDPRPPRRPRLGAPAAALAALAALALGACTSDPPTAAEQRDQRVRDRLEVTFAKAQVDCIMDRLDDDTKDALDTTDDLPADSTALTGYSTALAACVTGDEPTTTSTTAATTTTAADTTTTGG